MSDFDNRRELFTQSTIDTTLGTNAQKLYYVFTQELNNLKANYDLLDDLLDITYCTNNLLNQLASLVGTSRINGETDADLRKKIIATSLAKTSNGTAKDIINITKALDSIGTYELIENPESDTLYWSGNITLDGLEAFNTMRPATFRIQREVDDTDSVSMALSEFLFNAKTTGVNGSYSLLINLTTATHYGVYSPTWDGLAILDGLTFMTSPTEIQNTERWDGLSILDGTKFLVPFFAKYNVTHYKIFAANGELIKHEKLADRFLNGIYIFSAFLRESEGNGKYISNIQFLYNDTINFEATLPTPILKRSGIRLQFIEKNL